jgi:hypothetical protein
MPDRLGLQASSLRQLPFDRDEAVGNAGRREKVLTLGVFDRPHLMIDDIVTKLFEQRNHVVIEYGVVEDVWQWQPTAFCELLMLAQGTNRANEGSYVGAVHRVLGDTVKLPPQSTDPEMRRAAKLFWDGDSFTSAVLVEGNKAYTWLAGSDAEHDVKFLPKAIPAGPQGFVARALEESKGSDGLFYIDFAWVIRAALVTLPPSSFKYPQFSSLQLPTWLYFRGGTTFDVLLREPIEPGKGWATVAPILLAAKKGKPHPGHAQAPPTPRHGGGGKVVFFDGPSRSRGDGVSFDGQ